jgi:hypothetical protein
MTRKSKKPASAPATPRKQSPKKATSRAKPTKTRSSSKQSSVIAMLSKPDGTTIAAISKSTGWQQHSVRGFLAGVVRKNLGLNLNSTEVGGKRIYRIVSKSVQVRPAVTP